MWTREAGRRTTGSWKVASSAYIVYESFVGLDEYSCDGKSQQQILRDSKGWRRTSFAHRTMSASSSRGCLFSSFLLSSGLRPVALTSAADIFCNCKLEAKERCWI